MADSLEKISPRPSGDSALKSTAVSDNGGVPSDTKSNVPHAKFKGNNCSSDIVTIEIDLTDPEDLERKLRLIDITDEETDELLRQALEINKALRKELNRQTLMDSNSPHSGFARSSSFLVSAPSSAHKEPVNTPKSCLPPVRGSGRGKPRDVDARHRDVRPGKSPNPHPSPYAQQLTHLERRPSVSVIEFLVSELPLFL